MTASSKLIPADGIWTSARSLLRRWLVPPTDAQAREQLRRLRSFLPPQVWRLIATSSEEELMAFRRREIAVVFCDLRGFTAFAHEASSSEIVDVLSSYHRCVGPVIVDHDGILERFTGDGLMVYFDDAPLGDQARRAVQMAVRIRDLVGDLSIRWRHDGHQLAIGVGIDIGPATLGAIGFEQRRDYAAIGPVTNLASRLCAEAAAGEVLVTERLYAAVRDIVDAERLEPRPLKGFEAPVNVYNVLRLMKGCDLALENAKG
jgi:adenylate cyclase